MKNIYAAAITELERDQFSAQAVIFEIARKTPAAYVAAVNRLRNQVDWKHACIDLVRAGQKIEAIKLCRSATGMGLKEARDVVEALPR